MSINNKVTHHILNIVLMVQMVVQPMVAAAAGAAEAAQLVGGGDHAPSDISRPYIDAAHDTVPVVNINKPNGSGLSHNTYEEFNVGQQGVVLNNNATNALSQQAGWIEGNPNLTPGNEAKVILNEVVGGNRSNLNGYVEVAGKKADVIVANPNGITCKGCGFINTDRATLTTGKAEIANKGDGDIQSFAVQQGDVSIEGNGLDARQQGQVDILARAVKVNAKVQAQQLKIAAGANRVQRGGANDGQTTAIAGTGNAPTVAVDVSSMGGMYANSIQLVATDDGAGVNMAGETRAAGDIRLDVNGTLDLSGQLQGEQQVTAKANQIHVKGTVQSAGDVTLTGRDATSTAAGSKIKGRQVSISTTAGDTTHQGDIEAEAIALSASETLVHQGTTNSSGKTQLKGRQIRVEGGKSVAKGNITLGGNDKSHAENITLTDATLQSQKGDITLKSRGNTQLTRSKVSAAGSIVSEAASYQLNDSQIAAQNHTEITGVDGSNSTHLLALNSVLVAATGDLSIKADTLSLNHGQCIAGNDLAIQTDTFDNTANLLWAYHHLTIDRDGLGGRATRITNTESDIVAYTGDLSLSATTVENKGKAPTYVADGYAATWYETAEGDSQTVFPNTYKLLNSNILGADGKPKAEYAGAYSRLLAALMSGQPLSADAKALVKADALNPDGTVVADLIGTWQQLSAKATQLGISNFDAYLKQLLVSTVTDSIGKTVNLIQTDGSVHPEFAARYVALWEAAISGSTIPTEVMALLKPTAQTDGNVLSNISSQWDAIRAAAGAGYEIKKTLIADVLNRDGVLGQFIAGGNVIIDSENFNNLYANVSAGADIAITASANLNNVAYGASQTLHEVHKTNCFTCHTGQLGYRETFGGLLEAKGNIGIVAGNFSNTVEATRNTVFNLPALNEFHDLRTSQTPTPRDFKVLLDVQSPILNASQREQWVDATTNPLQFAALDGLATPFSLTPQTTLPYAAAVETRDPYINYGAFLSSDFMMKRLKYSPEHENRMNSDDWAGLRLLSNATANWRSNDRVAKGQASNTRQGSTQLSANNIRVYASGNISLQGGNTQAKQSVNLQANGDLTATAAAIGAGG